MYFLSERAEGVLLCLSLRTPTPTPLQHAAMHDRREVAKREENRQERAESACLSGLMMQSARNTPHPHPTSLSCRLQR